MKEAPTIQGYIFLEEPVNLLLSQIRHRGRAGEEAIDFPMVLKLQRKYDEMYEMLEAEGKPKILVFSEFDFCCRSKYVLRNYGMS